MTDVLIVGAGPTGLMLACELARRGVSHRIVDREAAPHGQSRATDVQSRTLEIFHDLGIVDQVLARGSKRTKVAMYANGQQFAHIKIEDVDTPYCYFLGIPQNEIEHLLEGELERLGGRVERGVRLSGLTQDEDGASATLLRADHTWQESRFSYVVGCDGAHSTVRHSLGFAFEGDAFAEQFFLADVDLEWQLPHEEIGLFSSSAGMLLILPLPGERRVRVFGDVDLGTEPALDLDSCAEMLRERTGFEVAVSNPGWASAFRVHTRMVESYRKGRAFLAGDAAHIHSPAGGHGMNTGIQDAYNLAWKLALVVSGAANERLLDSYNRERHPVARALLAETKMETRIALWRNRLAVEATGALMGLLTSLSPLRRRFIASALEIAINYRDSPIVSEHHRSVLTANVVHSDRSERASVGDAREFGHAPHPGDRAPDVSLSDGGAASLFELLRTTRHTLLLFDGASPTEDGYRNLDSIAAQISGRWGEHIDTHVVVPAGERPAQLTWDGSVLLDADSGLHHRYGAGAECLYLIRPDGYVGFRSQPADAGTLTEYLEELLGL